MTNTTTEPITLEAATRTHAIATLHSIADSFAKATHEPMPTHADLIRYDLTIAQFTAFIDVHAAKVRFGTITWWAETVLATEELHGIYARMSVHLRREDLTDVHRHAFEAHNEAIAALNGPM